MSNNAYLFLKLNNADINGESSVSQRHGVDLNNSIECEYFNQTISVGEGGGDAETQRDENTTRTFGPIIVKKKYDKSSPLLMQGLLERQSVNATFRFFRSTSGAAGYEQHKEIQITKAKIGSIDIVSPDSRRQGDTSVIEVITFNYDHVRVTFPVENVEIIDDWAGNETE